MLNDWRDLRETIHNIKAFDTCRAANPSFRKTVFGFIEYLKPVRQRHVDWVLKNNKINPTSSIQYEISQIDSDTLKAEEFINKYKN